jgi:carboxylate-amine ligase
MSFNNYRLALIKENKFRAARYGIEDIWFWSSKEVETRVLLIELLEFVDDVVDELEVESISTMCIKYWKRNWAAKQLAVFKETNDLTKVVDFITSEFTKGL